MSTVVSAHTSELSASTLISIRRLLEEVFAGGFSEEDWEHALGGIHAIASHRGRLVGHAAVVQRRLLHRGRALRAGYVEAVAVHPAYRRVGHASRMMERLEGVIARAYDLGALSATDDAVPLYERRGWRRWTGRTGALTSTGLELTPEDDGSVYVLIPTAVPPRGLQRDQLGPSAVEGWKIHTDEDLACDWRDGDLW